ncbi:MAG: proline racemase family protein [Dehalobacterium sp.]
MDIIQSVWAIDAHTTGTPIRVITGGLPHLSGDTISQKMAYMSKHFDGIRQTVTKQPRGFLSLVCAVLTAPTKPEADFGLFYFDSDTYQPMCGAGTLATAKAVVETGMVPRTDPHTTVVFDTAAGIVKVTVETQEDGSTNIVMVNAPAFAYLPEISLEVDGLGKVDMDIYFGGNFFAMVDTAQLGFEIEAAAIPCMLDYMKKIVGAVKRDIKVQHPLNPDINYLDECLFIQNKPDEDGGYLGQCIYGEGLYDLSPCGTGTCSRLAQRYHKGLLKLGEPFVHKQAYGGNFTGIALEAVDVGGYPGVIPQISCDDVHITGFNQLIVERSDRLKYGFKTW